MLYDTYIIYATQKQPERRVIIMAVYGAATDHIGYELVDMDTGLYFNVARARFMDAICGGYLRRYDTSYTRRRLESLNRVARYIEDDGHDAIMAYITERGLFPEHLLMAKKKAA
jgi:hypothetical protein